MLSHFGRALRALAVIAALFAAIAPASAHEGHNHEEQPPVSAGALPRGEADSTRLSSWRSPAAKISKSISTASPQTSP